MRPMLLSGAIVSVCVGALIILLTDNSDVQIWGFILVGVGVVFFELWFHRALTKKD
jgi:Na+/phosphate symporter